MNENENNENEESHIEQAFCKGYTLPNGLISHNECRDKFVVFIQLVFKSYLLRWSSALSEVGI